MSGVRWVSGLIRAWGGRGAMGRRGGGGLKPQNGLGGGEIMRKGSSGIASFEPSRPVGAQQRPDFGVGVSLASPLRLCPRNS